jgi:hypothetical protein
MPFQNDPPQAPSAHEAPRFLVAQRPAAKAVLLPVRHLLCQPLLRFIGSPHTAPHGHYLGASTQADKIVQVLLAQPLEDQPRRLDAIGKPTLRQGRRHVAARARPMSAKCQVVHGFSPGVSYARTFFFVATVALLARLRALRIGSLVRGSLTLLPISADL